MGSRDWETRNCWAVYLMVGSIKTHRLNRKTNLVWFTLYYTFRQAQTKKIYIRETERDRERYFKFCLLLIHTGYGKKSSVNSSETALYALVHFT